MLMRMRLWSVQTFFRWYYRFRGGRELVEDDERSGRPKSNRTEVNIAAVADLVKNDCRIASTIIAESFNIPKTTFQKIYDRAKACIYANGAYFELKKVCVFLKCLRFFKKSVLKLLDRTVNVLNSYLQRISTKFLLLEAVATIDICS